MTTKKNVHHSLQVFCIILYSQMHICFMIIRRDILTISLRLNVASLLERFRFTKLIRMIYINNFQILIDHFWAYPVSLLQLR